MIKGNSRDSFFSSTDPVILFLASNFPSDVLLICEHNLFHIFIRIAVIAAYTSSFA